MSSNLDRMRKAIADKPKAAVPSFVPPPAKKRKVDTFSARAKDRVMGGKGRLPGGARFDVTYDATSRTWGGLLYLPPAAEGTTGKVFEAAGVSGVFGLLEHLDDLYRAWLKENGGG